MDLNVVLKHTCVLLFTLHLQTVPQLFKSIDDAFRLSERFTRINEAMVVRDELRVSEYSGCGLLKFIVADLKCLFVIRTAPLNMKDERTMEDDADLARLEELKDDADVSGMKGESDEDVVLDKVDELDAITNDRCEMSTTEAITGV